jgi:hypothetical protein
LLLLHLTTTRSGRLSNFNNQSIRKVAFVLFDPNARWLMLSRQASAAASSDKYNDAITLMRESIASAQQIPNTTHDTTVLRPGRCVFSQHLSFGD